MIPTKGRPDFILRVLRYYSVAEFKGVILIGDSSNSSDYKKNSQNISTYSKSLRIEHYHDQSLTADKMVSFLCRKVTTAYSLMHPDDDIVLVPSLQHCLDFLDKNSEYSAVNGLAFNMGVDCNAYNPFGKVTLVKDYTLAESLSNNPLERVNIYFNNVKNINMSVIRSVINLDAFSAIEQLTNFDSSYVYGELTHASIVLSRGKVGTIDHCFLVRQKHPAQFYRNVSFDDWLNNSDSCSATTTLKNILLYELSKNTEVDGNALSKNIDDLLSSLMRKVIGRLVANSYYVSYFRRLKRVIYPRLKNLSNSIKLVYIKHISNDNYSGRMHITASNLPSNIDSLKLYLNTIEK